MTPLAVNITRSLLPGVARFQGRRRSPLNACRAFCLACCGNSSLTLDACMDHDCPLHALRQGLRVPGASVVKAVRRFCVGQCLPEQVEGVRGCAAWKGYDGKPACPLWPFRLGTNPNVTEETRAKLRAVAIERGVKPSREAV